ncbi:MAG: hypothetical protein AAFR99_02370 [Cyanobacteria bacterium J06629_9]
MPTTTKRVQYVLGTLSDEDLDWLVAIGQRQSIPPKTNLIESGAPTDAIYLIGFGWNALALADGHQPI